VADYNQATATSVSAGSLAAPTPPSPPPVGLRLGSSNNELPVVSYAWRASRPGTGTPDLRDFIVTLAPGSVEPGVWGALAAGTHLDSATIRVRRMSQGNLDEYRTYTVQDVTVSSFSTGEDGSGGTPEVAVADPSTFAPYAGFGTTAFLGTGDLATPGTVSESGGVFTVSGSHTYAEEGSHPISVIVQHDNAAAASVTLQVEYAFSGCLAPLHPNMSYALGGTIPGRVGGGPRADSPAEGGDDILVGGVGDDLLVGSAGQDLLVGGFAPHRSDAIAEDARPSHATDDDFIISGGGVADLAHDQGVLEATLPHDMDTGDV
jgi:hypothetical protein